MKHSPLQLLRYVVAEISVSANRTFDPSKPSDCDITRMSVETVVNQQKTSEQGSDNSWLVEMAISQKVLEGQNFPYDFNLIIVGVFALKEGAIAANKESQFVTVNGSSMLYSAARELIRSTTAIGPWGELFLPTVSFYDKETSQRKPSTPASKAD